MWIYNAEQNKFYINECKLNIEDFGTGNKGDAFIKYENNNFVINEDAQSSTLSIDELSAITSEPEDSSDIFSEEDLEDHSSLGQSDKKDDDFEFDGDFSSAFEEEDTSSPELKEEAKVESGADLDDFSSLPEPDDSVDFDEFSLEGGDVSSEDVDKLSEPR